MIGAMERDEATTAEASANEDGAHTTDRQGGDNTNTEEKAASRCRLLELPAELRNHIYEFVVLQESRVSIFTWLPAHEEDAQPALSLTCRQIRNECLPVYYDVNTFRFIPSCSRTAGMVTPWGSR